MFVQCFCLYMGGVGRVNNINCFYDPQPIRAIGSWLCVECTSCSFRYTVCNRTKLVTHLEHKVCYEGSFFSLSLAPLPLQNEVVCLPLSLARSLGHMSQVVICTRVTTSLHLTDPLTLQGVFIA